jgi:hypothetical protein
MPKKQGATNVRATYSGNDLKQSSEFGDLPSDGRKSSKRIFDNVPQKFDPSFSPNKIAQSQEFIEINQRKPRGTSQSQLRYQDDFIADDETSPSRNKKPSFAGNPQFMDEPGDIVQFEADYQEGVKRAAPRARNVEAKFNYEYDPTAYKGLNAPKSVGNVKTADPNDPKFDLNNEHLLLAVEEENEFYSNQFRKDDDNKVLGDKKSLQRGMRGESGSMGQKKGESPAGSWNGRRWMQPLSDESAEDEDDNRGLFCGICVSRKKPAPTQKSTEVPRPSQKKE